MSYGAEATAPKAGSSGPGAAARREPSSDRRSDPGYLTAKNVTIAYAGAQGEPVVAIDNVDFEIRKGEFVCLVGPSGCGKTTFLNAVAGFLPITAGELLFQGAPIVRPGPDRAMVFQQPGLLPWRNVLRNDTYSLEMSGQARGRAAEEQARALLELVGLADFARSFPHQLSGGMQQRVNLARALAVEPELLLLDEPFASVDAQTREKLQIELLSICERAQITALFVTHDIGEAVLLADRVCVLSRRPGRVVNDIVIDLAKPRDDARLKPEFLSYLREVGAALAVAANGPSAREKE